MNQNMHFNPVSLNRVYAENEENCHYGTSLSGLKS